MQKKGKSKAKDNIWLKQAGFFIVVLAWILAIFFKNELSRPMMITVFILLVVATIFVLFWLNRAFFGLTASSATDESSKEKGQEDHK